MRCTSRCSRRPGATGDVGPEFLGRHRELDGLLQGVRGSARLRARRLRPVAEGEEPDLLHTPSNSGDRPDFRVGPAT